MHNRKLTPREITSLLASMGYLQQRGDATRQSMFEYNFNRAVEVANEKIKEGQNERHKTF
jgi:hypothetical protein